MMDDVYPSEWIVLLALLVHLIMCPFTKVEESFNVQAIHDILYHRGNISQYDHLDFPGVVPRTFVGPLMLGSTLMPLVPLFNWLNVQKYWMLLAARFVLGFAVAMGFCNFSRCIEKRFGASAGTFLRLITVSQFHFMFYASRPLPNTFALILVLFSFQKLLDREFTRATILATAATFMFRFELVLLYGPMFLMIFGRRLFSIWKAIAIGLATLVIVVAISVPLDSFFWQRLVWPEGEVIWFNVVLNRSSAYGILPFWWYFTSALPRGLAASLTLLPLGFLYERKALLPIIAPAVSFIAIYSFLPHKELRFIIYAFPLLNVSAAVFCAHVWDARQKSWLRKCLSLGVAAHLLANVLLTAIFLYASSQNYPGGQALAHLQHAHRYMRNKPISVHIDAFSAENGISRFLQLYDSWEYNKTENLRSDAYKRFDYILMGSNVADVHDIVEKNFSTSHKEYFAVPAFHRIDYKNTKAFPYYTPSIKFKEKVIVLKKK
ncbi:alg9-like mannosyltransferase family domain-containing protein [Ditylenchus destructor]|nr:alg9-like mannosyltransferase family domain-containing protein [Ditylenchus destructor]